MIDQLDIEYWLRARTSDPHTSHEAAERVPDFSGRHFRLILEALTAAGRPLAAEEIADRTSIDYVAVGKRTKELATAGHIVATDELHTNRSGRRARRYRVVSHD